MYYSLVISKLSLLKEIIFQMNEQIKTFSLVVITICVFIMTVIEILKLVDERKNALSYSGISDRPVVAHPNKPIDNTPKTTVSFKEMKFDFGQINEGDVVNHTFAFTNTGSNPLIITNAVGSCGCTVPTYPKEPIAPGANGNIEVQFNSHGKAGEQDKTITVSANTPEATVLNIHASVNKKE